jgi:tripartite-type tricarboxylate transporter receptor subunit TctC
MACGSRGALPRFAISLALAAAAGWADAQSYPAKPVRIILSSPGGGTDIVARFAAENMSRSLGAPFVVESRQPNVAAAAYVARSPPDGYTLLVSTASYLVNSLLRQPQYQPLRDFSPVTLLGTTPIIIVVHPALPVNSVRDLVALAKQRPGELNYGSGGVSSPLHLAAELFKQQTRVEMLHVPYKGTVAAATDLQAGRVQVIFPSIISLAPQIKSGRAKVLAILSERRSTELPDVPTTREAGFPGLIANIWYGLLAPGNMPSPLLERLNKAAAAAMNAPQVAERLRASGVEPVGNTPAEFSTFAVAELAKWKRVVELAKIDVGQ